MIIYKQNSANIISRTNKIEEIALAMQNKTIFMFNGMPGSGKTTLAKQAAKKLYHNNIYYPLTDEDKDPINFCVSLYRTIQIEFPGMYCEELEMPSDKIDTLQYEKYIKEIFKSLKKQTKKSTAIILDDVEKLPPIGLGCNAVKTVIGNATEKIHFFICSRRICQAPTLSTKKMKEVMIFDDDFLRYDKSEFSKLALQSLSNRTDYSGLKDMFSLTEGWATGVKTVLNLYERIGSRPSPAKIAATLNNYFNENLNFTENQKIRETFPVISFVNHIPIDLLIKFSGNTKLVNYIITLFDHNIFIKKSKPNAFSLHPIFRLWLNKKAEETVTNVEKETFLNMAADKCIENGDIKTAVEYFLQGKIYSRLEQVLKVQFDYFLSSDNEDDLNKLFELIPENILNKTLWTAMAYATISTNLDAEKAHRLFINSYHVFDKNNDDEGKLIACAGIANFHFLLKSNLSEGLAHYKTGIELFNQQEHSLSDVKASVVLISLAYGGMLFSPIETTKKLLEKARILVERIHVPKLSNKLELTYSLFYELNHSMFMFKRSNNILMSNLHNINNSSFRYLNLLMKFHRYFALNGNEKATNIVSDYIRYKCNKLITTNDVYRTLLELYDAEIHVHNGELEVAYSHFERIKVSEIDQLPMYVHLHIIAFKALLKAVEFNEEAITLAQSALELSLDYNFSSYLRPRFLFIIGACYAMLGMYKEGLNALLEAYDISVEENVDYVTIAAAAYTSYLYSTIGDKDNAQEYAVIAIKFLSKNSHKRFIWSKPFIIQNMLHQAFQESTVKDHTAKLAYNSYDLCFSSKDELIPVMMINAFGEIEIRLGEACMASEQLAGNFRLMIALLLSSNNFTMHQEIIQAHIWPSSNKDNARKSFDNLLSRFRKLLSDNFYGINPKDYITINNGIVRLKNIKCNSEIFITDCHDAITALKKQDYTQCISKLSKIKDLYIDRYFPFTTGIEIIDAKRLLTDTTFITMLTAIYKINQILPDLIPLEEYITKWLDIFIHETDMIRLAYKFYADKNDIVKCRIVIKKFRNYLEIEDFSQDEIDELIYSIKSNS